MSFIAPAAFLLPPLPVSPWERAAARDEICTLKLICLWSTCRPNVLLFHSPLSSITGHRIHLAYCNDIPSSCLQITRKEACTFFPLSLSSSQATLNACKGSADFTFFHLLFNIAHAVCTFISFISDSYDVRKEQKEKGGKEVESLSRFFSWLCPFPSPGLLLFAHSVKPLTVKVGSVFRWVSHWSITISITGYVNGGFFCEYTLLSLSLSLSQSVVTG